MLQTENLYLGAFALLGGARLERIVLSRANGRRTAVFELEGDGLEALSAEFFSSRATVNLAAFRQELEFLKDRLFEALHEPETETEASPRPRRRAHEENRQGRARGAQAPR